MPVEKENTLIEIPRELHERLKIHGVRVKKTLKELIREIVGKWLSKTEAAK